ncbi:MAG: hypothetical protein MUC36_15170 [Planctomycetes bacterium]|nr:hypothetical protein [Planctomycetota bacterium]
MIDLLAHWNQIDLVVRRPTQIPGSCWSRTSWIAAGTPASAVPARRAAGLKPRRGPEQPAVPAEGENRSFDSTAATAEESNHPIHPS